MVLNFQFITLLLYVVISDLDDLYSDNTSKIKGPKWYAVAILLILLIAMVFTYKLATHSIILEEGSLSYKVFFALRALIELSKYLILVNIMVAETHPLFLTVEGAAHLK